MKCLILAAGYGTRMQGIIGDRPKALVEVAQATLLDHLVTQVNSLGIDITVVSNQRYVDQFERWSHGSAVPIQLLNDGSTAVDNRLGAIGDMAFAIEAASLQDDLLILAADNYLPFSLSGMIELFSRYRQITLAVWKNDSAADQQRRGVVALDNEGCVAGFDEKPSQPASMLAAAPIYILPAPLCHLPQQHLERGGNADAPGNLFAAQVGHYPMRAWMMPDRALDVGNPESYAQVMRMLNSP